MHTGSSQMQRPRVTELPNSTAAASRQRASCLKLQFIRVRAAWPAMPCCAIVHQRSCPCDWGSKTPPCRNLSAPTGDNQTGTRLKHLYWWMVVDFFVRRVCLCNRNQQSHGSPCLLVADGGPRLRIYLGSDDTYAYSGLNLPSALHAPVVAVMLRNPATSDTCQCRSKASKAHSVRMISGPP